MAADPGKGGGTGGVTFFTRWFWLWLVLSIAYALPISYYADTSRPTQSEIKRAWIHDALVQIAEYKRAKGGIVEARELMPLVPEDHLLDIIDKFWADEALAYRAFYRAEPPFLSPVRALNAKYRERLAAGVGEREDVQLNSLLAWAAPVLAGLLVLIRVYYRKRARAAIAHHDADSPS